MKHLLSILVLMALTPVGFPQGSFGTVNFNNRVTNATDPDHNNAPAPIDAPIRYAFLGVPIDGAQHPTAQAALYAGPVGTPEALLVLVGTPVGFRSGTLAGYVNVGSLSSRFIPGTVPGGSALVQIRAWDAFTTTASSYEDALALGSAVGKSSLLTVNHLGVDSTDPANILGLTGFSVVPEPSAVALGLIALAGSRVFHRKS